MPSYLVLTLLIFLHINTTILVKTGNRPTITVIDHFEQCKSNLPMELTELKLSANASKNTILNGKLRISRDIGTNLQVMVKGLRCRSKDSLDNCDNFVSMKLPFVCAVMKVKHEFWSHFYGNFRPPLRCPMKKGDYILDNAWFNASVIEAPDMTKYYWKLNVTTIELPRTEVWCYYFQGYVR